MDNALVLHLICVTLVGVLSISLVKADDPYRYFTWTVTYGTASPLGVPKQVINIPYISYIVWTYIFGIHCSLFYLVDNKV